MRQQKRVKTEKKHGESKRTHLIGKSEIFIVWFNNM